MASVAISRSFWRVNAPAVLNDSAVVSPVCRTASPVAAAIPPTALPVPSRIPLAASAAPIVAPAAVIPAAAGTVAKVPMVPPIASRPTVPAAFPLSISLNVPNLTYSTALPAIV